MNKFENNKKKEYNFNYLIKDIIGQFDVQNKNELDLLKLVDNFMAKYFDDGLAKRIKEEVSKDIVNYGQKDVHKKEDLNPELLDEETLTLIKTFLESEKDFKDEIFNNPRIEAFYRKIHNITDAKVLIDIGKEKMQQIEYGQVKEEDLELVEAEIIVLFTQMVALKLVNMPKYIYNEEQGFRKPPMSMKLMIDPNGRVVEVAQESYDDNKLYRG